LSRTSVPSICTNAIVVEISRASELLRSRSKLDSGGACNERDRRRRCGRKPPSAGSPFLQVLLFGTARRKADERQVGDLVVGHGDVEAIAELLERIVRHLLRLVRDHLSLADSPIP
jgi:hypothetical protein